MEYISDGIGSQLTGCHLRYFYCIEKGIEKEGFSFFMQNNIKASPTLEQNEVEQMVSV